LSNANSKLCFTFYRVPGYNFLKELKLSSQTILVHNQIRLIMYQKGSPPYLDVKRLLRKQNPTLFLNLGDYCFSTLVKLDVDRVFQKPLTGNNIFLHLVTSLLQFFLLKWSLESILLLDALKRIYYDKNNYLVWGWKPDTEIYPNTIAFN